MTVKEAIEVLKGLCIYHDNCKKKNEALDLAIEVLEKVNLIQFNVFALNELLDTDTVELQKVSSRPKSEQYVCPSCGEFCYYPHCKAGIQSMTLEEAIEHCKEQAATLRMAKDYGCDECAAEHEQLAEWLEELQQRRGRATDLAALESLRKQINETGRVRGISGTIVQSVRPCVASGVRAAIQTLIDLTNKEIIVLEEGGPENE